MSTKNEDLIIPVTETVCRGTKIIRFEFKWVVEGSDSADSSTKSPIFSPSFDKQLKFYLTTSDPWDLSSYCLCLLPCDMCAIRLKYKLYLGGDAVFVKSSSTTGIPSSTETTQYKMVHCRKDVSHRSDSGELIILSKIKLMIETSCTSLPSRYLLDGIQRLLETGECSDVKFDVDGRRFSAHKAIVSIRSPVLAAMFKHDTMENRENRVAVTDVEPEVFMEMLRFVYTDKAANIDKMADKLLAAADKYQIDGLKALCEDTLFTAVTMENAADILILADLYNATNLKKKIIDFIVKDLKKAAVTQRFRSMIHSHPSLIAEVLWEWGTT